MFGDQKPVKSTIKWAYRRLMGISLVALVSLQLSCSHALYYGQSIQGHLKIMLNQVEIDKIIQNPETDDEVRRKLKFVVEVKRFATESLGLPDNGSYENYNQLGRDAVVWNVIAAPELSLQPVKWCFLIVGCLPYRGYFNQQSADKFAEKLKADSLDVYVGGVSAYSTLGWFKDPLLSSMINRSDNDLAKLIFHELAHQKFYFRDDTDFNEAFADTVAIIGIQQWLGKQNKNDEFEEFQGENRRENEFVSLILRYQNELTSLYQSDLKREDKLIEKKLTFERMRADYKEIQTSWNGNNDYEDWFEHDLNNAKISTILTYRQLVPAFQALYARMDSDLQRFYDVVEGYSRCTNDERKQHLINARPATNCDSD